MQRTRLGQRAKRFTIAQCDGVSPYRTPNVTLGCEAAWLGLGGGLMPDVAVLLSLRLEVCGVEVRVEHPQRVGDIY